MRNRLNRWIAAAWRKLNPRNPVPALIAENRALSQALGDRYDRDAAQRDEARRYLSEIAEAQTMGGSGPWLAQNLGAGEAPTMMLPVKLAESLGLKEAGPVGDISPLGSYGMYELLLQNVNWQREINYSWLEFTRWGIQQIILICRLYYIKNPICRRLVDVIAQYVFARGFDVTSDNGAANDVIKQILQNNAKTFGHVALTAQQRSKNTDGNLFWVYFTDPGTGECEERLIDATEIQEIITDPDDADMPWYFQRIWTQRAFSAEEGAAATRSYKAWYPAINVEDLKPGKDAPSYHPANHPETIKGDNVMWESPVYHRKIGTVGKWLFGCPPMYPMIDWAKESRRFLEACASVRQSLSQFAMTISTKGGQQAIEGIKQQMETQVGPGSPIYDSNPPAVAGATWVSGPGTNLEAFKVQGATFSPDDVKAYLRMCCMCFGMPETFLSDVSTGNLATATSLDRPTETVFLSIQEEWIEDITVRIKFMLSRSAKAPGGKLFKESGGVRLNIRAAARRIKETPSGARFWAYEAKQKDASDTAIEIRVQFPAIREGDMSVLVAAGVQALTLGNKGGQIVGVDEKAGILWLMKQLGFENAEELIEKMYATNGKDKYDPSRAEEDLPAPIPTAPPVNPGGAPQPQPAAVAATQATQNPNKSQQAGPVKEAILDDPPTVKEAVKKAFDRLSEAVGVHLNGE